MKATSKPYEGSARPPKKSRQGPEQRGGHVYGYGWACGGGHWDNPASDDDEETRLEGRHGSLRLVRRCAEVPTNLTSTKPTVRGSCNVYYGLIPSRRLRACRTLSSGDACSTAPSQSRFWPCRFMYIRAAWGLVSLRSQQEQQLSGLADDVTIIGSKDTAKAYVRLGLGVNVDAKKMAQHGHDGCSLVVYRSFQVLASLLSPTANAEGTCTR
jgi:hypothetical protein